MVIKKNKFVDASSFMYDCPTDSPESSKNYYKSSLEHKINEVYQYASTNETISEEVARGTQEYEDILCRVNKAIDPVTGNNIGEDFRSLKFFNLDKNRKVGDRFFFSGSTWIVSNINNYKYITKSVVVRRCNNEIRWLDSNTGSLINEPCVVDYSVKYASTYFSLEASLPQGTIDVFMQYNDYSNRIKINDRFVIGDSSYKVKYLNKTKRLITDDYNSVGEIVMTLYYDDRANDDNYLPNDPDFNPDFPYNIANINKYKKPIDEPKKYEIFISPDVDKILKDKTEIFLFDVYENGNKLINPILSFDIYGPDEYFSYNVGDNTVEIKNLYQNNQPVIINAEYGDMFISKKIILGGVY